MSIENQIAALTAAVIELTNVIKTKSGNVTAAAPVVAQSVPLVVPTPVVPVAAPVVAVAPVPVMASPSSMPAPPTFAPAPAPMVAVGAPFTDGKGLIDYVMGAYKAMGAQKGAMIQNVLTGLGYQNINDVKPEHYAALFNGVEALKVS
jgi:hypothetical protein